MRSRKRATPGGGSATGSIAASGSWVSAIVSTAPRTRARECCAGSCTSSARSRIEVAEALERAALEELQARRPDRILATNIEFWAAVVLDFAEVPPQLYTPMFGCARVAGWSAHILEQKREGRMIRPSAKYVGAGRDRSRACSRSPRLPRRCCGRRHTASLRQAMRVLVFSWEYPPVIEGGLGRHVRKLSSTRRGGRRRSTC